MPSRTADTMFRLVPASPTFPSCHLSCLSETLHKIIMLLSPTAADASCHIFIGLSCSAVIVVHILRKPEATNEAIQVA
jgi:hypothetical protein